MEERFSESVTKHNLVKLLRERELKLSAAASIQRYAQVTETLIKRIGLEYEFEGHRSCVNCLEWSTDGKILASGSDDKSIILWDPFRHKMLKTKQTSHVENIFTIKFLGDISNNLIVTGAGDGHVIIHSVDEEQIILDCSCHADRVKCIVTAPDHPQLFWSAAEDGLIIQYDLREPHQCISNSMVLLDLARSLGWETEAKCLAVNPTQPHLLAVGTNDCFVRIYDRRMIKTTPYRVNHHEEHRDRSFLQVNPDAYTNCVQYYAPGHLAQLSDSMRYKYGVTHVTFDPAGQQLLVNMGCEQIYIFDVNSSRDCPAIELKVPEEINGLNEDDECDCGTTITEPLHNNRFLSGTGPAPYLRRASTLQTRNWIGDKYAATRDYLHVIKQWPNCREAYIELIRCLIALKWKCLAGEWLSYYLKKYPQCADSSLVSTFKSEIAKPVTPNYAEYFETPQEPSESELKLRDTAIDYETRYIGHCNTETDIMEANFFGPDGQFIIAGSDDGIYFIWDRHTTHIVRALWADLYSVNCVQPHPTCCMLATCGIDPVVKLWSPRPDDGSENMRVVADLSAVTEANQKRIAMDPFELMLANMGYRSRDDPLE